ncbi:MAG: 50S ribosomal protein L21 [Bradymonadaceae bacterium]
MHAVIETGGNQYRISPGDEIEVEKLKGVEAGKRIAFKKVLAAGDGEDVELGRPHLEDVDVVAEVLEHGKGPKKIVFRKKPKTGYKRKQGHRQPYTRVRIEDIREDSE